MILKFRAEKMIDRCIREGKEGMLDEKTRAKIWALDGADANTYNWAAIVHGEDLAWIDKTEEHAGAYVAVCDCE